MTPTGRRVAVCIPAYREVAELAATCATVWACGYPRELLQLVVAVDGGDQATVQAAERAGATVVTVQPNQGSYAARNAAVDAIDGDVDAVLFTDVDCRVAPGWVSEHLAALDHADLSGGGVRFTFHGDRPAPAEWVDSIRHLKQQVYVERDGYAATCNLAVRAEVLRRFRFDASLRTGGDAEFCRAVAGGGTLVYTEAASVDHPARRTTADLLTKVRRIAGGVRAQRERWVGRELPPLRLTRGPWRRARAAGYDVGLLWGLRACLLDYWASRMIVRAVRKALADPSEPSPARTPERA